MTDRELLELAAKAAGYMPNNNWAWSERAQAFRYRLGGDWIEWNPLVDDADALRLAVKLTMMVDANEDGFALVVCGGVKGVTGAIQTMEFNDDLTVATRRAIVRAAAERAAAEIGEAMK